MIDGNVKVRDHCNMTRKYRGSRYRDCNIKVELNHEIPIVFHNLKKCDSHLIMQELGKLYFKIDVLSNGLKNILILTSIIS